MGKKIISALLLFAMILPVLFISPVTANADGAPPPRPRARIVAQHRGGAFSRPYVEIEMNGEIFKTNESGWSANRNLFDGLSDGDKRRLVDTYGNYTDRYTHFGGRTEKDIGDWAGWNKKWNDAGEVLAKRVAAKNYPDLFAFYENPDNTEIIFTVGVDEYKREFTLAGVLALTGGDDPGEGYYTSMTYQDPRYKELLEQIDRLDAAYMYGKSFYGTLKDTKMNQVATAVKSISEGLIKIIVDNALCPSLIPKPKQALSGVYADITANALGVAEEMLDISGLITPENNPKPREIIDALWRVIEKAEAGARDMEKTARETIDYIGDLLSELDMIDRNYREKLEENIKKSHTEYTDKYTPFAVPYSFTVDPESKETVQQQITQQAVNSLNSVGTTVSTEKLFEKIGAVFGESENRSYEDVRPVYTDVAAPYWQSEAEAEIKERSEKLPKHLTALKAIQPEADSVASDYVSKMCHWKGIQNAAKAYEVTVPGLDGAMRDGESAFGYAVSSLCGGGIWIDDLISVQEKEIGRASQAASTLSSNNGAYNAFIKDLYEKYLTERNNYEVETIYYENTLKKLFSLRDGFRFYITKIPKDETGTGYDMYPTWYGDNVFSPSMQYISLAPQLVARVKEEIGDDKPYTDNVEAEIAERQRKAKNIAAEIKRYLDEEARLIEILNDTKLRAQVHAKTAENILNTAYCTYGVTNPFSTVLGVNADDLIIEEYNWRNMVIYKEISPGFSVTYAGGEVGPTAYLYELRAVCLGNSANMYAMQSTVDDLYNNYGKWQQKVKTEEGMDQLKRDYNRVMGSVMNNDSIFSQLQVNPTELRCYVRKAMYMVYGEDMDFAEGPYLYYLFDSLLNGRGSYVAVTGISVSPSAAAVGTGKERQLTATVTPSNATRKDVYWVSADEDIAAVNGTGTVIGISPGDTAIYAYSMDNDELYSSVAVTVEETKPDWIADVSRDGETVKVIINNVAISGTQSLLLPVYEDSQLVEIKKVDVSKAADGVTEITLDYPPDDFKLLLWDGDMRPLGDAYTGF